MPRCSVPLTVSTFLVLVLAAASRANERPAKLLLVVGNVKETEARVLYEAVGGKLDAVDVTLNADDANAEAVSLGSLQPEAHAKVFTLRELSPATRYRVQFGSLGTVTFTTGPIDAWRALVLSCDRHADHPDDVAFKQQIAEAEHNSYDFLFHIGDQVYADRVVKAMPNASFDEALEAYRNLYREAWTETNMAAILSHGSHWMIPDDHEVMNSLQPGAMDTPQANLVAAGLRTVLEYQTQLLQDIEPLPADATPQDVLRSYPDLWRFQKLGNVGVIMLDTRFQRTFQHEEEEPLTGTKQLTELREQLSQWAKAGRLEGLVVLSAIPLFFPTHTLALVADYVEQEKYGLHPHNEHNTRQILDALADTREITGAPVLLVGGDNHLFAQQKLCRKSHGREGPTCLESLTTSGITEGSSTLDSPSLMLFQSFQWHFFTTKLSSPLGGWTSQTEHISFGNNYAVVWVDGASKQLYWNGVLRELTTSQEVKQWIVRGAAWGLFALALLLALAIARCFVGLCCRLFGSASSDPKQHKE